MVLISVLSELRIPPDNQSIENLLSLKINGAFTDLYVLKEIEG